MKTNVDDKKHFYLRFNLGISCNKEEKGISALLEEQLKSSFNTSPAPSLTSAQTIDDMRKSKSADLLPLIRQENNLLIAWWLQQLHHTTIPLQERMVIFWHNHFTSSAQKVRYPELMYRQHLLFRKHALGSFAELLKEICNDPAMIIYLDTNKNTAKAPNENFARELLELFTLGEGYYTESDIINAAKSFTGKRYNVKKDQVIFTKKQYDSSEKIFLGKKGNFSSDNIIDILLEAPRTAEFIAEKFWNHFINTKQPNADVIKDWAKKFRESNYQIRSLLLSIIESEVFWEQSNRGVFIKSPIEFTIGLLRELELNSFKSYGKLANINTRLGQRLFYPPDVKGWRGGFNWLDNSSFVLRQMFAQQIVNDYIDQFKMNTPNMSIDIEKLGNCLLILPPINIVNSNESKEEKIIAILSDPVYQLR